MDCKGELARSLIPGGHHHEGAPAAPLASSRSSSICARRTLQAKAGQRGSPPDLPGLRGRSDGLDGSVGQLARDCHLNLDLGYKSNCIFGPAIELAMPSLAPVALDLGRCHSWHADRIESIADLFELKWLDDCDDELHECTPRLRLSLPRTQRRGGGTPRLGASP